MFPAFAGLLPGLIQAGGKFLKRTAGDILAGKNVLQSAKANAIEAANEVLPGAGDILEKGINAVGSFINKKKIESKSKKEGKQLAAAGLRALKEIAGDARKNGESTEVEKEAANDWYPKVIQFGTAAEKARGKDYMKIIGRYNPGFFGK